LLNRIPVFLSEQQKFIYYKMFSSMTPNEFHKLLLLGSEKTIDKNTVLTLQDQPTNELYAILSGEVEIKKDEKIIAKLGSGYLIGEMSVLSQHHASATVMTTMQTQALVWSHDIAEQLQKKDRILFEKFKHILTLNLIKKIDSQAEISVELH
jgi:CRP-like cAMP-binding protein